MKNTIITLLFLITAFSLFAENAVYQKLYAELDKYAVVYNEFNGVNFPVMSGNTEMGGLLDPLGRGVFNIEMNDLYLNCKDRITGAGMMLKIPRFSGLQPQKYKQYYDLKNGVLNTQAEYADGSYSSEMFFSQDDKEIFVLTFTNTGATPLLCDIDLGQFALNLVNHTNTTIYAVSNKDAFTPLQYFLQTNLPFEGYFYGTIAPYLTVKPQDTLKIVLRLRCNDNSISCKESLPDTEKLCAAHIKKWRESWESMGFIVLPEGEYARAFYRSLHWLQCAAGGERNLPGECQFGVLTSRIAAEYQFHGDVPLNGCAWNQNPFTYGAAGWSALAYTFFGNSAKADKILSNMYRPKVLRKNVTAMFPVGDCSLEYAGKAKGLHNYLSYENPSAICFAHELLFDRASKGLFPYEMQIHIQGFAPAMYYHFVKLYDIREDTVYSVMRGAAEFWSTILNYDPARKMYSLPPVLSLTEDLFEADLLDGLLAAKWTLMQASEMAKKRNTDKDLQRKWMDIVEKIRFIDKDDIYLEFKDDNGGREGAGYQGIRAYAYLGFPTLELMRGLSAKKVNKSLDQCWLRNKKGEGMITFVANWFAITDAFWGRAEEAYEKSAYCLTQIDRSGTAMCEQNKSLYYFLTGYSSFVLAPLSMVLQTVENEIRVFPAVPKAFENIEFYNLPANGNIRVSGVMKNGKAEKICFEKDGKILKEITGSKKTNFVLKNNKITEK
ncbi:MAG: hypothetical protein LBH19_14260 [Dysgonamonadaceae bacterium]|jgi:hypothetical protein|nr:hypothetical protein [Dysgonamonadaceae bacterium]